MGSCSISLLFHIAYFFQECHIPCFAHIINLVVQDCVDELKDEMGLDFNVVLGKIRELAKGIRKSTLRWELFQKCCLAYNINPSTIPIDLKTRWNSMMRMLEAAIYLRRAVNRFLMDIDDNSDLSSRCSLTDAEWELIEIVYAFLIPFKRVTKRFESNQQNPEIDYLFFAYDRMFNHIDDVLSSLRSRRGLGALPCASVLIDALKKMEKKLTEHYTKTSIPSVYGDAMILNPRCKFSIFNEETWSDVDPDQYSRACRRRFEREYLSTATVISSSMSVSHGTKRSASGDSDEDEDPEFQALLAKRAAKRTRHDYDRYVDIPNNPDIKSTLGWWSVNQDQYRDLSRMARDVLAVPASGCSVERLFSISGRIANWQRARLQDSTISDSVMYKAALGLNELPPGYEDEDLPIPEVSGKIPSEWEQGWWKKKLQREVRSEILDLFDVENDDEY